MCWTNNRGTHVLFKTTVAWERNPLGNASAIAHQIFIGLMLRGNFQTGEFRCYEGLTCKVTCTRLTHFSHDYDLPSLSLLMKSKSLDFLVFRYVVVPIIDSSSKLPGFDSALKLLYVLEFRYVV